MFVKVGDKVKVLTGKDKGKEGTILVTLKEKNRVVVEGVNIVKKHIKPGRTNENGGIVEVENSIHASNVKVLDSKKKETKKETKKDKEEKTVKTTKKSTKKVGSENE